VVHRGLGFAADGDFVVAWQSAGFEMQIEQG